MPNSNEFNQIDHDLLVRLHERFSNFETTIITAIDSVNSRIGKVMSDVDTKADYREFNEYKEKINGRIQGLEDEVKAMKIESQIDHAKKGVYVDLASWTWKHWAQVATIFFGAWAIISNL